MDLYRPHMHFAPRRNWINDPNGLVWVDGTWHLFYQHNPLGDQWGNMSWGHAISADLMTWQERPVALWVSDVGMIFSGSCVRDGDRLIAAYTQHCPESQCQCLAFGDLAGEVWAAHDSNPVLDLGLKDFRDPRLWRGDTGEWWMAVAYPTLGQVGFFRSDDLTDWIEISRFPESGTAGEVWECPDVFPITGANDVTKWVLVVSIAPDPVTRQGGVRYRIGDFTKGVFVADEDADWQTLDYGPDFYAWQSWSEVEGRRRVGLAWMMNWTYAALVPTEGWRGAMSAPRELSLVPGRAGGWTLTQYLPYELVRRRTRLVEVRQTTASGATALGQGLDTTEGAYLLDLNVAFCTARQVGLRLRWGGEDLEIMVDAGAGALMIDRTGFGRLPISGLDVWTAPVFVPEGRLQLAVLVDACSLEVFAQGGETALTLAAFPHRGDLTVECREVGGICLIERFAISRFTADIAPPPTRVYDLDEA